MNNGRTILYAEDEGSDVYFVKWALKEAKLQDRLSHVADGQEAIDYLSGVVPYSDRGQYPVPDLLLLDLKMPRLNGFDVLTWLRQHPETKQFPVVVFSSSSHEDDQRRARDLGATEYQVKPNNVKDLIALMQSLHERYLA